MAVLDYDVVIIGAGPAGLCAGLYAGRAMLKAVVLEQGLPGGELLNTEVIEDYIGFEHILGWELAEKFNALRATPLQLAAERSVPNDSELPNYATQAFPHIDEQPDALFV